MRILPEEIKHTLQAEPKSRLCNGLITGVCIDSRRVQPGDLFIALRGENFDGHDFVARAIDAGACTIVIDRDIPLPETVQTRKVNVFKVADSRTALGQIAKFYRQQLGSSVRIIAITGTAGKTTVREMVYHVLSKYHKGCRSEKNYNNDIGVPLTLLSIKSDDEFAVVEMGSNAPGEIAALSRMAEPDIAVITHVGPGHLQGLLSVDGVSVEKVSIVSGLRPRGIIICGSSHKDTLERVQSLGRATITFGLEANCDVYATNIERVGNTLIRFQTNDRYLVEIPLSGVYNVRNALAALAVVRRIGISTADFAEAIRDFKPVQGRMTERQVGSITIIDDTYNANPVSMAAALAELSSRNNAKRRVLVCGDMEELGTESRKYHEQLGRDIVAAGNIDFLMTVGPKSRWTAKAALDAGMGWHSIKRNVSSERLARIIKSMIFDGDVILVKGSRVMEMEKVIVSLNHWRSKNRNKN